MAHILIVEDEPDIRELIGRALEQLGHTSDQASDGLIAQDRVAANDYDLIITDIRMPRCDGIQFLKNVQEQIASRTPCMIITAFHDVHYAAEATRLGACNFLTKPFSLPDIAVAVRRGLDIREGWTFREKYQHRLEVELRETLRAVLIGFAGELEEGTEASDHCQRVSEYATVVAKEMGIQGSRHLLDVQLGAILHDIGKARVPTHVRCKPGKLNEEEWAIMREHPVEGERIASKFPILRGACSIIRHHHERYDGTGYPDGLRGDDIPLNARIFSVVDAFDTITEVRCYKEAQSCEFALDEIKRGSGTQFDPDVVMAFERVFSKITAFLEASGGAPREGADVVGTVSLMAEGFTGSLEAEVRDSVNGNGRNGNGRNGNGRT